MRNRYFFALFLTVFVPGVVHAMDHEMDHYMNDDQAFLTALLGQVGLPNNQQMQVHYQLMQQEVVASNTTQQYVQPASPAAFSPPVPVNPVNQPASPIQNQPAPAVHPHLGVARRLVFPAQGR